jgi:spermidine synthase
MKLLLTVISFFTGYAGLVYEVTWHRYLANLLGSQAQATALILAVFLGGLAVGYGLFGRWSRKRPPKIPFFRV